MKWKHIDIQTFDGDQCQTKHNAHVISLIRRIQQVSLLRFKISVEIVYV
jgi:hypothetical protein